MSNKNFADKITVLGDGKLSVILQSGEQIYIQPIIVVDTYSKTQIFIVRGVDAHTVRVDTAVSEINGVAFSGTYNDLETSLRVMALKSNNLATGGGPENRIYVTQENVATTMGGAIDSTKEYFIDGIVDFTGVPVTVPDDLITISGYGSGLSKIICADAAYTLFTSIAGGSGDVFISNISIEITGVGSKVYDLTGKTGLEAIELERVNYNTLSSMGEIKDYRQGFENIMSRNGGKPELTLSGTWLGGYVITNSIVHNLADGAYTLFKAGAGFSMQSRFKTNQNVDLPTNASLLDFFPSNFPNPSTLQLQGMILTRNGSFNAADINYTPNISQVDLGSDWENNVGLHNTFVGGFTKVTAEVVTAVAVQGDFYDIAGTFAASDLQHFDSPSNGQLRHLGNSPTEFKITGQFVLESTAGNVVQINVVVFRAIGATFEVAGSLKRVIDRQQGPRDVAYFTGSANVILNKNDYVKFQVANLDSTGDITAELDSFYSVERR